MPGPAVCYSVYISEALGFRNGGSYLCSMFTIPLGSPAHWTVSVSVNTKKETNSHTAEGGGGGMLMRIYGGRLAQYGGISIRCRDHRAPKTALSSQPAS